MPANEPLVVNRRLPVLASVRGLDPYRVAIRWAGEDAVAGEITVDLAPMVERFTLYRPLREDPALFAAVRLGPYGSSIEWGDGDIDVSADSLEFLIDERREGERT